MTRVRLSNAAAGLLRALLARAGVASDRILLSAVRSVDWQSLTFTGERHHIHLRVPGPQAEAIVQRMTCGLEEAEFAIPGQIVADIGVAKPPQRNSDGSIELVVEALTISE